MHKPIICAKLDCPDDSLLQFTNMTLLMWGRDMILEGLCLPIQADPIKFKLESIDCREMKWQLFTHHHPEEPAPFVITDVVSFKIGQSHHRKPATVLTDHFGLTWNYKTLNLRYGSVVDELE